MLTSHNMQRVHECQSVEFQPKSGATLVFTLGRLQGRFFVDATAPACDKLKAENVNKTMAERVDCVEEFLIGELFINDNLKSFPTNSYAR